MKPSPEGPCALPFGTLRHGAADDPLDIQISRAIIHADDPSVWENLLERLRSVEHPGALRIARQPERRRQLEAAFFRYVEDRDRRRGSAIMAHAQRSGLLMLDSHGEKIRAMAAGEMRALERCLRLTGLSPRSFSFLGCGGAPETLLHIERFSRDRVSPLAQEFHGIDNRAEAVTAANALFNQLGRRQCKALAMEAGHFVPCAEAPGVVMTAAYLHPAKQHLLDGLVQKLGHEAVLMVRSTMNGHALFGPEIAAIAGAEKITTVFTPALGVKTDLYYAPAA